MSEIDPDLKHVLDRLAGGDIAQMPATVWAERVLCNTLSARPHVEAAQEAWSAELRWLRDSLHTDGITGHLQELVVDRWLAQRE